MMKQIMKSTHFSKLLTTAITAVLGLASTNAWAEDAPQTVTDHIIESIVGEKPVISPSGEVITGNFTSDTPTTTKSSVTTSSVTVPDSEGEYSNPLGSEELNKFKLSASITPETTALLGEQIDLNTGSLSFSHTDVSIPGNNAIDMSVGRVFKGKQFHFGFGGEYAFEDWQLDIPYIHTSLAFTLAGFSGSWGQGFECSGALEPGLVSYSGVDYSSDQFWTGDTLHVPGKTHEKLLDSDGVITTGSYGKVTQSNWRMSCIDRYEGGNLVGQGFVAHSPDGLTYTFSKLKLVAANPSGALSRYQAYMLVTKVEDRFGNEVNYHYTDNNLTSITSTDGRSITLSYTDTDKPYRVTSVSANNRTWNYGYTTTTLQTVTRPDSSAWSFYMGLLGDRLPATPSATCGSGSTSSFSVSMTHPNGVTGTFAIADVLHGRTNVPQQLNLVLGKKNMSQCFYTLSVKTKTLSGAGLSNLVWDYDYSQKHGTWDTETTTQSGVNLTYTAGIPASADITDSKTTTVTAPDNSKTVYFYNRDYSSPFEGSLQATDQFDTNGTSLLMRSESTYQQGARIGLSEIQDDNVAPQNYQRQKSVSKITRYHSDGDDTYTTTYSDFNIYGVAQKQIESNDVNSNSRYSTSTYGEASSGFIDDTDTGYWLLNQPLVTSISSTDSNYTPVSETTYHSATSSYKYLPYEFKKYGQWQSRNSEYHLTGSAKGALKKVEYNVKMNDNNYRYQTLNSYHRGQVTQMTLPGKTSAASAVSATKTVDDNGWVIGTIDLKGNPIGYDYDDLGRMTLINPAESTISNTTISFTKVDSGDTSLSGVVTNMYKQTVTQGNHETVNYIDALHRTLLVKERDKTESSTTRYTSHQVNAYNKTTFSSFPSNSAYNAYGHQFTFDGLQRQINQQDTVTNATSTTTFKKGNKVTISDFNGHATTATYQAYGSPSQKLATNIASPEGITTLMSYNLYNGLDSITQGGITESRYYDGYQQLCKTVRPDVGDVVFARDSLGQISWQATGTSTSTTACDISNVNGSEKTSLSYNNWGLVSGTTYYADTTPDISYGYDNNGNMTSLSSSAASWSYQYNNQNQLKQESLTSAGKTFNVSYGFNSLGHMSSITYPTSRTISFSPNALGQSTQANGFATAATYHSNGALKTYSANNGTSFSQTQTFNQLPRVLTVSKGASTLHSVTYSYDNNYNIIDIINNVNSNNTITNTYDDVDRLATSNGNWGNGTFNYNTRGDITSKTLGANNYTYNYNSNGVLNTVTGAATRNFTYNSKGAVTNNAANTFTRNQAGQITHTTGNANHIFTYDGHGRRVIDEKNNKKTFSFYSQSGTLLYQYDEASQTHSDYIYLAGKQIAKADFSIVGGSALVEKVGYTGHQFDEDLGLNYMQARYYDPVIGRFYSNDPIGFTGAVDTFNRYSYVGNNPYKYTDPTGMFKNCNSDPNCSDLIPSRGGDKDDEFGSFQEKSKEFHEFVETTAENMEEAYTDFMISAIGGEALGVLRIFRFSGAGNYVPKFITRFAKDLQSGYRGLSKSDRKGFRKETITNTCHAIIFCANMSTPMKASPIMPSNPPAVRNIVNYLHRWNQPTKPIMLQGISKG